MEPKDTVQANMLSAEFVRAAYIDKMRAQAQKAINEIERQLANQTYLEDHRWERLKEGAGDAYSLKLYFRVADILNDFRGDGEDYVYVHELTLIHIAEHFEQYGYQVMYNSRETSITLIVGDIDKDLK